MEKKRTMLSEVTAWWEPWMASGRVGPPSCPVICWIWCFSADRLASNKQDIGVLLQSAPPAKNDGLPSWAKSCKSIVQAYHDLTESLDLRPKKSNPAGSVPKGADRGGRWHYLLQARSICITRIGSLTTPCFCCSFGLVLIYMTWSPGAVQLVSDELNTPPHLSLTSSYLLYILLY